MGGMSGDLGAGRRRASECLGSEDSPDRPLRGGWSDPFTALRSSRHQSAQILRDATQSGGSDQKLRYERDMDGESFYIGRSGAEARGSAWQAVRAAGE